jgi:acyl carrier protein
MEDKFVSAFKVALEIKDDIKWEDEFRNYAQWDSLSHMSLIAMLDSEFKIQIENRAFEKMKTVRDIFDYVQARVLE